MDPVTLRHASAGLQTPTSSTQAGSGSGAAAVPFGDRLAAVLEEANATLQDSDAKAEAVAAGEGDIVEAMISLGRADVSLRLVLTLRNRLVEAYQEVMRLQV